MHHRIRSPLVPDGTGCPCMSILLFSQIPQSTQKLYNFILIIQLVIIFGWEKSRCWGHLLFSVQNIKGVKREIKEKIFYVVFLDYGFSITKDCVNFVKKT